MAPQNLRLFLLLVCAAGPEVLGDILMRPSCAAGWFYYMSNCYGYFRKLRSWSEAEFSTMNQRGVLLPEAGVQIRWASVWEGLMVPEVLQEDHDPILSALECQSYGSGAHLVSLQNADEATTVAKHITGYQRIQPVWIGLHNPGKKQQWQWIDGAPYVYRSWSGASRRGNKYCAALSSKNDFLAWESNECSARQHFVCKYRP